MPDAQYEWCQIKWVTLREESRDSGFFSIYPPYYIRHTQFVAEVITPKGVEIVARSSEFLSIVSVRGGDRNVPEKLRLEAEAGEAKAEYEIQQKLMVDGWEPHLQHGRFPRFRRPILTEESYNKDTIPSLIEALAKLHQLGILTDTEFEEKKSELLKRL